MKLSVSLSVSVAILLPVCSLGFLGPTTGPCSTSKVVCKMSKAEDHLQEMERKWNDLKAEEALLVASQEYREDHSMEFAVKMVETAIERVHAQEEVKEEHVESVHAALERALDKEKTLEYASKVVHHDGQDADGILSAYSARNFGEDLEKRRELAVADLAHNVEGYLEERIHDVQRDEARFREQEEQGKEEVTHLKWNEAALEHFLGELKRLQKEDQDSEGKKEEIHHNTHPTWDEYMDDGSRV